MKELKKQFKAWTGQPLEGKTEEEIEAELYRAKEQIDTENEQLLRQLIGLMQQHFQ